MPHNIFLILLKGKMISEVENDTIKAYGWNGYKGPYILSLNAWYTYMTGQFHILTAVSTEYILQCPLDKRVSGTLALMGEEKNRSILSLPGNELQFSIS
jgi:hypothetical protein